MKLLKLGCLFIVLFIAGIIVFAIYVFIDFPKFTNEQACTMITSPDFQAMDDYFLNNEFIKYISYQGMWENEQNIWKINNSFFNFDTSMIILNSGNIKYESYTTVKNLSDTKIIPFTDRKMIDSLISSEMKPDRLKYILDLSRNFKIISITRIDPDNLIEYRFKYCSPISQGFGLLTLKEETNIEDVITYYDEVFIIDSLHYRFLEYAE